MLQNLRGQVQQSDAADAARRWMSLSWLAVVIGSVYILSARLSLSLLTPDGVAVFWPAAGVAAGALIAFGPPARWAVVAGTIWSYGSSGSIWKGIVREIGVFYCFLLFFFISRKSMPPRPSRASLGAIHMVRHWHLRI
jgi:hypothetical protein